MRNRHSCGPLHGPTKPSPGCLWPSHPSAPHLIRGPTSFPGCPLAPTGLHRAYLPARISPSSATLEENNYFGPSFFSDDLSLLKNFPIHESIEGQFRVDAFNGFNYISPGNPNGTCIDCAAAGSNGVITGMALGHCPGSFSSQSQVKF